LGLGRGITAITMTCDKTNVMDPSQYAIFLIKYEKKEIPAFLKVTFAVHHQRATNAKKSQNEIIRF
jgi:hypothetical protein